MKDPRRLTLEEKIGQLFVVGFQGYEPDHETRLLLDIFRPGGVLLFQRNIESFDQIYDLTSRFRDMFPIPPLLAIDHEGGRVDRLKQIFAPMPSMPELAAAGMAQLRLGARIIAAELEATGFNLDFAPVLDLRLPGSIVFERSLASTPGEVARLSSAFLEELAKKNIVTCAKHFPGLGGATVDPHFALPRIDRNKRQLLQEDVAPFAALFGQVDMIMMSHAHYPGLGDEKPVPASLSSRVIDGLLRKKLGYKGLVVTDDLTMGAVTAVGLTPDLFLRAFEAGNDLLLFSQTTPLLEQAFKTILIAARGSATLRKRVDESVERILALKGRIEFVPLRYRTHLKARITRQIEKLRKSVEPALAAAVSAQRT
jgi:beta-N-acetylhexosaminidase